MNIISQSTIDSVKQVDIVSVIGKRISLKKSGHRHTACCPFHDEKSPSFSVSTTKQIFKCFGCGAAGDGISFIMKSERLEFIEAIKLIATEQGVPVNYESITDEEAEAYEQEQKEKQSLRILLTQAAAFYQGNTIPAEWLTKRKFEKPVLNQFKAGYAEQTKDALHQAFTKQGWTNEKLVKAGLVREVTVEGKEPAYYDFFQERVVFPIHDLKGNVIAFTGRLTVDQEKKKDDANTGYVAPKYVNSPDSIWTKGQNLYGLHLALEEIQKKKFVYLVEGNPDVIRFHHVGVKNVVAPCGTAITVEQIKLLKRFTSTVVIVGDNDTAGRKAVHRSAQLMVEQGMNVKVLMPKMGGADPDDYIKSLKTADRLQDWLNSDIDYINDHLLGECLELSEISAQFATDEIKRMAGVILSIPDDILRSVYYDKVASIWKAFKKNVKLPKTDATTGLSTLGDEERQQIEEQYEYGFYEKEGSYYIYEKKSEVRICCFTIDVLFYVVSDNQPKYVCRFKHMLGRVAYKAITTDDFTSVSTFKKVVERQKGFVFEGSQAHLDKIKIKLFYSAREAYEPQHMGFNNGGKFYTWANGLYYNKRFIKSDKYGIVNLQKPITTIEDFKKLAPESRVLIGEKEYTIPTMEQFLEKLTEPALEKVIERGMVYHQYYHYLPFSSSLKLTEDSDDDFELERKFKHFEKSNLAFADWAQKLTDVYGENGKVMICFYLAALYRHIIFKANNNYFPILYNAGPRGGGKSKAAESLARMFGDVIEDGINLESGSTTTGINRYMSSVQDGLVWLNEYKNTLAVHVIGMLKGIADGSGKITGRATQGNQTKSYKPKSSAIICGQDLPTKDPALLSRCIINEFSPKDAKNVEAYQALKELEKDGATTSVTCEMLNYREQMLQYRSLEPSMTKYIKERCKSFMEFAPDDRSVLNLSSVLVPVKILMEQCQVKFPFSFAEIIDIMLDRLQLQTQVQAVSDDCEQYFMVLQTLIGREIFEGEHFKVQKETDGITKLFLRIKPMHNFYLAAAARQGITPLSIGTIRSYLMKHRSFLEDRTKNVKFANLSNTTSAIILNYDLLLSQGIEFKTSVVLKDLVAVDDPSKVIHLNGNAQALINEFMQEMPAVGKFKVAELLAEFNGNKEPQLEKDAFVNHILEYRKYEKRVRDFDFDSKEFNEIKVRDFQPF